MPLSSRVLEKEKEEKLTCAFADWTTTGTARRTTPACRSWSTEMGLLSTQCFMPPTTSTGAARRRVRMPF